MEMSDFTKLFGSVWFHRLPDGLYPHETLLEGSWAGGANAGYRSPSNPQFLCRVQQQTGDAPRQPNRTLRVQCELVIPFTTYNANNADLMLNMCRGEGNGAPIREINIGNTVSASMHTFTKAVHLETQLAQADQDGFILIPTFGNCGQSLTGDFRIIVRSDKPLRVQRIQ